MMLTAAKTSERPSNDDGLKGLFLTNKETFGTGVEPAGEWDRPLLERPTVSGFELSNSMQLSVWAIRYRDWDQNTGVSKERIPEHTFCRVAEGLAMVERYYRPDITRDEVKELAERFYQVMVNKEFMPAGRTLSDVGTGRKVVSNCVVLGIDDKLTEGPRSIMSTMHEAVKLQCQGCGLGFAWDSLRPYGTDVVTGRTQSSGIVSYFNMYAAMFATVKQTNSRHGANMGMCLVDHPEVLEFVRAKDTEGGSKTVFNITILLTDEFMQQATDPKHPAHSKPWVGKFSVPARSQHGAKTIKFPNGEEVMEEVRERPFFIVRPTDLFNDKRGRPTSTWGKKARKENSLKVGDKYYPNWTANEIMEHIAKHSWSNGEPGFGFYDEVQRTNPLPGLGPIKASNPCGEQFLHDGDVCNLGSVNAGACVGESAEGQPPFYDWDKLKRITRTALHMLENVIDITEFNSTRVQDRIRENRRVGLGIMGFADACYAMRIAYGSPEAEKFAKRIMKTITREAEQKSRELAEERGSFPNIHLSVFADKGPMRNAACTTIAPTGTIAALTGVCGGCEPYFAPAYTYKNVLQIGSEQRPWVEDAMKECCRNSSIPSMRDMAHNIDYQLRIGPHREFVKWMSEIGRDAHSPIRVLAEKVLKDRASEWLPTLPKVFNESTGAKETLHPSTSLYDAIMKTSSLHPFADLIPSEIIKVFVTSQEIPVEQHIKMQAAFQKHTNNSISKTLNLPNSATVRDVRDTIELAWKSKLKGCTLYRDGSRQEQVLNLNSASEESETIEHKSVHRVRFQDLINSASAKEYRTLFETIKGEIVTVEMTPSELEVSLRSNIARAQRRNEHQVHRDYQKQMKAMEEGLAGISFEEEETAETSDDDDQKTVASSSSSSSPKSFSLSSSLTPPGRSIDLRMSMDGSPMCTRGGGCGSE